jgi:hypothetical protein
MHRFDLLAAPNSARKTDEILLVAIGEGWGLWRGAPAPYIAVSR